MGKSKSVHLCVAIDKALAMLKEGKNIFDGSPHQAMVDLLKAKEEGKTFYTGCDNMAKDGMCKGHNNK